MGFLFSACETVPKRDGTPPVSEPIPSPVPVEIPPQTPPQTPTPPSGGTDIGSLPPPIIVPPTNPVDLNSAFKNLAGWSTADLRPALMSFQRSCEKIIEKDLGADLISSNSQYGRVSDWHSSCVLAQAYSNTDMVSSRTFFESEFLPVNLSGNEPTGTVTGYYQPEINVSKTKTNIYSEAVLSVPSNTAVLSWPRSKISETSAAPIAYGKPIDVFFMQIQGSGVLVFEDGQRLRAAYAKNNGYSYTSIGRVLIQRGELQKDKASKQDIEAWMAAAGPQKSKALMDENKRYIFFQEEPILQDEGPKGAMRVPLTDMASIAVDPSHYPYGVPYWLETKIPSGKGDYIGQNTGLLTISQDTGKAIRGAFRADLYFGSGFTAGDKAGVMKHPATWTVLLPFHLALQLASIS